MNTRSFYLFLMLLLVTLCAQSQPQPVPAIVAKERAFYSVTDVPLGPVLLEVGGMAFLPDGRLAVCTRRGEIWLIEDPYQKKSKTPKFTRFARGLHEPLELAYHEGSLYVNQRAELTKDHRY